MLLHVSRDFTKGFSDRVTGGGTLTYSPDNRTVITKSTSGASNGAMKDWFFVVNPGDVIEIQVWAKNVSGDPRIAVDLNLANDNLVSSIHMEKVNSPDWKLYKAEISVPENTPSFTVAKLVLGVPNAVSIASEGHYTSPKIKLVSSAVGQTQVAAMGLIRVAANGVVDIHPGFKNFGIQSAAYNDTTKEITVTLSRQISSIIKPNIQATATMDQVFPCIAGNYIDGVNPTFKIAFTNGTAKQSLMAGGFYAFVRVEY